MKVYHTYANIDLIIGGRDNESGCMAVKLCPPTQLDQSNDDW